MPRAVKGGNYRDKALGGKPRLHRPRWVRFRWIIRNDQICVMLTQGRTEHGWLKPAAFEGEYRMADDPIGASIPTMALRPSRDRPSSRDERVYDPLTRKKPGKHSRHGGGHGAFEDDISVLGIPNEEMTESVRTAIDLLLGEINKLRDELSSAQGHEAFLASRVEHDPNLEVLNRQTFLARIGTSVRHAIDEKAQFSFAYIPITNVTDIGKAHGRDAFDAVMGQAAAVIRETVEAGDVVGSLENHDFGIIMPGTPLGDAITKAQNVARSLSGRQIAWQGRTLEIAAAFGVAEILPEDTHDDILARAQRALGGKAGGTSAGA